MKKQEIITKTVSLTGDAVNVKFSPHTCIIVVQHKLSSKEPPSQTV